jgi:hypothetical protein
MLEPFEIAMSSAILQECRMTPLSHYLDELKMNADRATAAENEFRAQIATRIRALENERAFAYRRLNLMRLIAEGMNSAENEEAAVAAASAMLRTKLGWVSDSNARTEVISHFVPVAQAMFDQHAPEKCESKPRNLAQALAEFENWYASTHTVAFWALFENVMPETPIVDF